MEEVREFVDNDLGFQKAVHCSTSHTKTFLFVTNDKKVSGCLIAEHINNVSALNHEDLWEVTTLFFDKCRRPTVSLNLTNPIVHLSYIGLQSTF